MALLHCPPDSELSVSDRAQGVHVDDEPTTRATTDPAGVNSPADLAACMRELKARRGLSHSDLTKAAEQLPKRNGQAQTLPRSTVSDMLAGKRVPSRDKLLTFLHICRVSQNDLPQWFGAWERARAVGTATPEPGPSPRQGRVWPRAFGLVALTAMVSAAVTAVALHKPAGSSTPPPSTEAKPALALVQNKIAAGPSALIEDGTPAYLSTRTLPYCARQGCKVAGTDMHSGALLPVTCQVVGARMTNYNLDSPVVGKNPNRADSARWYRGVFPDGRSGYLSEVYLAPSSRGGLGLPTCR